MSKKICHWGPLIAFAIIKFVSWTTVHCTTLWLPFNESIYGVINGVVFFSLAILTVYNLLCAIIVGPGFVPQRWRPLKREDENFLQYCHICEGFKAPRSHHCRKCGRCVLKMDHHCPWLNNCVGHFNHGYFIMFLFFAVCGSIYSLGLLSITLYKFFNISFYYVQGLGSSAARLSAGSFICCVFSMGVAFGVSLALSFLLIIQIKSVLRNRTGIEDWILEKAEERRTENPTLPQFIYPYNLGRLENFKQVFYNGFNPFGDGIHWQVRQGAWEYDLTVEQLEQKELKRLRKKPYKVIKKYSGAILPITNGFCTCVHPPYSVDTRMALMLDETVHVTRYHSYWLFGEKICESKERFKGWFPKSCVVPITEYQRTIKKSL